MGDKVESKMDVARRLYMKNAEGLQSGDIKPFTVIIEIETDLDSSRAMASTYYYKAKKEADAGAEAAAKEAANEKRREQRAAKKAAKEPASIAAQVDESGSDGEVTMMEEDGAVIAAVVEGAAELADA